MGGILSCSKRFHCFVHFLVFWVQIISPFSRYLIQDIGRLNRNTNTNTWCLFVLWQGGHIIVQAVRIIGRCFSLHLFLSTGQVHILCALHRMQQTIVELIQAKNTNTNTNTNITTNTNRTYKWKSANPLASCTMCTAHTVFCTECNKLQLNRFKLWKY